MAQKCEEMGCHSHTLSILEPLSSRNILPTEKEQNSNMFPLAEMKQMHLIQRGKTQLLLRISKGLSMLSLKSRHAWHVGMIPTFLEIFSYMCVLLSPHRSLSSTKVGP